MWTARADLVTRLTPRVYSARLVIDSSNPMNFVAGQYATFILEGNARRTFSFASSPKELPLFELCADITPMGAGSKWLVNLKQGAEVQFLGPLGRFVVDSESTQKKVFVATGTGIAPIKPMIEDYLRSHQPMPVSLYWGLRFEEDLFWQEYFETLAQKYPQFSYSLVLSRASDRWQGKRGRATDYLISEDIGQSEFYLCGNRDMIHDISGHLVDRGATQSQIITELFY